MAQHRFAYPARFTVDEDGRVQVRFRDVPAALTEGDDDADAIWQAADCLEEAIAATIIARRDIPTPSPLSRGDRLVSLAPGMAAKAALYQALRESGKSQAAFATALGCDQEEVRRMLDPKHATKIAALHRALATLGKTLVVEVGDAA